MKRMLNILVLIALLAATAFAGVPVVTQLEMTDVTPGSFAVTWVTSETSVASLSVYEADCATPASGLTTSVEKNDATGMMRATASGLMAGSTYCYQTLTTSVSTSDAVLMPATPVSLVTATAVLRTMTTGTALVPFANDLLKMPSVPAAPDGVLEVLYLTGGRGPISVLLTADPSRQYFDMNNLFDAAKGTSINLSGGELLRISERQGRSGCVIDRFRKVPADLEATRVRDMTASPRKQDVDFNGTVNILDVLRTAGGLGTTSGGPCFNSDLDMTNNGQVNQADVDSVITNFDATP